MKGWTEERVRDLKRQNRIRGYEVKSDKKTPSGRIVAKHFKKRSKEKDWMAWNLFAWCNEKAVLLKEEYRFDLNGRRWRFDWCIEAIRVGIEYNGIMSERSRHTSIKGYNGDMQKITAASKQGWTILQYTPLNYRDIIKDLDEVWKAVRNERDTH